MSNLILGIMLALTSSAPPPITISSSTYFAGAPATLYIKVRVEKHPENHRVCLSMESDSKEQFSCWPHEGIDAPVTSEIRFRDIPGGEYVFWADLTRRGEEKRIVSNKVYVKVISERKAKD